MKIVREQTGEEWCEEKNSFVREGGTDFEDALYLPETICNNLVYLYDGNYYKYGDTPLTFAIFARVE
jgi:hypothetical protein